MYAVIETGGKQFRVELGTTLEVDRLEAEPGATLTIDRVLLVADGDMAEIGRPTIANASVSAEVVRATRGEKLTVFKYRPKARSRVKKGHRSELTVLRITDIRLDGRSAAEAEAKTTEARKTERERLAEAAARQAEADAALATKLAAKTAAAPVTSEPAAPKARRSRGTAKTAPTDAAPSDAAPSDASPAETKPRRRRTTKAEAVEPTVDVDQPAAGRPARRPKTTPKE